MSTNEMGLGDGIKSDGVKLGRTRVDLDLLCGPGNQRCEIPKKPDGSVDTTKPIFYRRKKTDGTSKQTLDEFLATDAG